MKGKIRRLFAAIFAIMMTVSVVSTDVSAATYYDEVSIPTTLADTNEELELVVNEGATVKCEQNHFHNWVSSDPSVATVTTNTVGGWGSQSDTQTITAKKAGNATITCTGVWSGSKTTYTVRVKEASTASNVYVYVEFKGVTDTDLEEVRRELGLSGGTLKNGKWLTVGYVQNVGIAPASKTEQKGTDEQKALAIGSLSSLERYNNNKMPIDWITSWNLKSDGGATDYPSAPSIAWHLDGTVDLSKMPWTVEYVDKATGANIKEATVKTGSYGQTVGISQGEIPDISGYKYVSTEPENRSIKIGLKKNVITIFYNKYCEVNYEWTGLPEGTLYDENGNTIQPQLPEKITELVENDTYRIDTDWASGSTLYTHDEHGNQNGKYTFSGWNDPGNGVMKGVDITVKGSWTYASIKVATHKVAYNWSGLPNSALFGADGNEITKPELPEEIVGLVKGQSYAEQVDKNYTSETVYYTHDAYGNQNGSYTFSGWSAPNNGVMGDDDATIKGSWTAAPITVASHSVTYDWGEDAPTAETEGVKQGDVPTLPSDNNKYVKGQPYTVDGKYTNGFSVNTYDAYGNVNGVYTFSGWTPASGKQTMGEEDVKVTGSWKFTETEVATHNVSYEWTGLPEGATLYNATGESVALSVPESITALVKGQPYVISMMPGVGRNVYTKDANGNVDAKYTFIGWTDPNKGVMGEDDVVVTGEWKYTKVIVTQFTVAKEVLEPKDEYLYEDTIQYEIIVTSQANVDLNNIVITDQLSGTIGQVTFVDLPTGVTLNDDNTVTITTLAPGAEVKIRCEYQVDRTDGGSQIANTVSVNADPVEDPENPDNPIVPDEEGDSTDPVDVEQIYNLIIHYVYATGGTAAPDVRAQYFAGESYGYPSPVIEGYTPDLAFLRTGVNGMPAKDVELTVTYTANPTTPTPTDPTTPTPPTTPPTPPVVVVPTPDGPATIPAPVLIGEEEVPLGGEVTVDDDGNVTIVPVEDEEVPLSNRDIDGHNCCALHFLLTLAAFIIYLFFTKSMKKRQAKINELRDQYETEVLKRKLGIADNDKDRTV